MLHTTSMSLHIKRCSTLQQVTNDDRRYYEQERLVAAGPISWPSHCHTDVSGHASTDLFY